MILSVTLNPAVDHVLFVAKLAVGDTNRVRRVERDAGGKGVNLSRVVAELGGDTLATGFLGGGPGAYIKCVLDKQGVRHDFVEVEEQTRTNFSVEDEEGGPPTTFNERGAAVAPPEWEALLDKCRELAPSAAWAGLGGSLPPGAPIDAYAILGRIFREAGCKVVLDADDEPLARGLEAVPYFIKPNSKECGRLLGCGIHTQEEVVAAAERLLDRIDPQGFVVVSRGGDGAVLSSRQGSLIGRSPQVKVRSTIGSGDSLIGGMLWALEAGKPLEEAFRWGMAAGAATATTDGSEIARRATVERLLEAARVDPA